MLLYTVTSRAVAAGKGAEGRKGKWVAVLARTLPVIKVLSCRSVEHIFKAQFLPIVPYLGLYLCSLPWQALCCVSAAMRTKAASKEACRISIPEPDIKFKITV